jgi:hypothetical protein
MSVVLSKRNINRLIQMGTGEPNPESNSSIQKKEIQVFKKSTSIAPL